jgi:hypothetical protein
MATTTRFTYGISTAYPKELLASYPLPDPFGTSSAAASTTVGVATYESDFVNIGGTEYTVSGTSSTFAPGVGAGGVGVLTPGGATTATSAVKTGQSFQFQGSNAGNGGNGNKFWYTVKFQVSALGGTQYVGLQEGSSTSDGIWFAVDASGNLTLVSAVGSTNTVLVPASVLGTVAAATWVRVGFYYNGTDLLVFQNNLGIARITAPTIGTSGTTLTSQVLTPVFEITPTATQTLSVDFVLAAQEVVR